MKRLLIYLAATLAVLAAVDIALGYGAKRYMATHRLQGDCSAIDYMLKEADEDIIVIGNSLVINSIKPSTLTDSLRLSAFNGGSNGQNLVFFETMLNGLLRHHTPKVVVLGLRDELLRTTGIGERYNILTPYYQTGNSMIDSCLESRSAQEKYLLQSSMYRFNRIWWRMLLYHFVTPNDASPDGFIAKPVNDFHPALERAKDTSEAPTDERMETLGRIVSTCRNAGIKLIAVCPPLYVDYRPEGSKALEEGVKLLRDQGVTVLDYTNAEPYISHPEYFFDDSHLNSDGAEVFSRQLSSDIKNSL